MRRTIGQRIIATHFPRRSLSSGRDADLDGLLFEGQIKTILQHAWSKATHDLIYKTDTVSWARERIAYQVKAMLEHAEIAIAEADRALRRTRSREKEREDRQHSAHNSTGRKLLA